MPPAATAATTASDVQLAGVPLPITRVGRLVSTARASAGTAARPFGLPATGRAGGVGLGLGLGLGDRAPSPLSALGGGCGAVSHPTRASNPVTSTAAAHRVDRGLLHMI